MLPASRSGTTRICARPATSDLMPLIRAASGSMALSKASGPSSMPPVIWPRSAILQSAAASIVEGILDVTVSTADRIATRGVPKPTCVIEVDGVLDDVALGVEIGEDVDRGVGDEQRLGIGRHVHDEDVADAAGGAQAAALAVTAPHQFVGVQAALHQQLALGLVDQFDAPWRRPRRCGAHRRSRSRQISRPCSAATSLIFALGPDQDRLDHAGARRLSTAPRSEVSSQGCTTIVGAGGTALAAAIRRSYLAADGSRLRERRLTSMSLPILADWPYDAFALGSKGATFDALTCSPLRRRTARRPASAGCAPRR